MRIAVFVLAALEIALFVFLAVSFVEIGASGLVTMAGIIMAVLLAPALILAINRRALGLALGLTILSWLILLLGLGMF